MLVRCSSKPSKLDLDVIRALDGVDPDPSRFPYLHDWLKNVKSFSEQQQKWCVRWCAVCVAHPCGAMEARWTSNSKVVGSSPIRGVYDFFSLLFRSMVLCKSDVEEKWLQMSLYKLLAFVPDILT